MKSIIAMHSALFAAFMTLTLLLYSQTGYTHPSDDHDGKGPDHLVETLILSESQKVIFLEIMTQQHEMKENIRIQYKASRDEERSQMDALHEETLELLSPVLTAEQLDNFETQVKKHRPHRPQFSTINYF